MPKQAVFLGAPRRPPATDPSNILESWYAITQNTGNLLIGHSLAKQLEYDFVDYTHQLRPEEARERCDIVVIAAANFINDRSDFAEWARFIEAVDLPCLVVGLGGQAPSFGHEVFLKEGTERFLRAFADRSVTIGVRGAHTAQLLSDYGVKNVELTGCPSLYMALGEPLPFKRVDPTATDGFVLNGSRDVLVHSVDQAAMTRVIGDIYRQAFELGVHFVLQTETDELNLLDKKLPEPQLREAAVRITQRVPSMADLSPERVRAWVEAYTHVFFSIESWQAFVATKSISMGTRFHGNLIAVHAGLSSLFICHDARTLEMCQLARLPYVEVDRLRDTRLSAMAELIDMEPFTRRLKRLTNDYADFLSRNNVQHRIPKVEVRSPTMGTINVA
jgi:hypothetical protein